MEPELFDTEDRGSALQETPEGHLWITVVYEAFEDLRDVAGWMPKRIPLGPALRPSNLKGSRRARMREQARRARSVIDFFLDNPQSTLRWICELFGYDEHVLRKIAANEIEESRLRERLERAEEWLAEGALST